MPMSALSANFSFSKNCVGYFCSTQTTPLPFDDFLAEIATDSHAIFQLPHRFEPVCPYQILVVDRSTADVQ
jgi:hypothetical protein